MTREPRHLSDEEDARIADVLTRMWDAYRTNDAAAGIVLGLELVKAFPHHGEAWFWLGCCRERAGELQQADRCFLRARNCALEPQAGPFRVTWRHFQQAVASAGESLPADLGKALEEVTLVLADYADPALLENYSEPEIMGLFDGLERGEREGDTPELTPTIYIFRRSHEHACASRSEFDVEIRQTLLHELGHYLGYDEKDLDALGLG